MIEFSHIFIDEAAQASEVNLQIIILKPTSYFYTS
jgi:hypothetical protein